MTNDDHVVTWRCTHDGGKSWILHGTPMEVSCIHHNVCSGFPRLKVGVDRAATGAVMLADFRYRAW